jgi:hypothetical protein
LLLAAVAVVFMVVVVGRVVIELQVVFPLRPELL